MKDPKGHGSNKRGFDGNKRFGNSALEGYGVNSPAMMEARKAATARIAAAHQNPDHPLGVLHRVVAEGVARSGAIVGQDTKAATELARGNPKAATAPVHPGAAGPQYHRGAVDNAIASSNRAGRRIGGREAKMIHALLKGRH